MRVHHATEKGKVMKEKRKADVENRSVSPDDGNESMHVMRQIDVCILCGAPVPEGMLICPNCERELEYERLH